MTNIFIIIDHLTHKDATIVSIKLSRNDLQFSVYPTSHNVHVTITLFLNVVPLLPVSQQEHPYTSCKIMHT